MDRRKGADEKIEEKNQMYALSQTGATVQSRNVMVVK
jgi:hypothetical protein